MYYTVRVHFFEFSIVDICEDIIMYSSKIIAKVLIASAIFSAVPSVFADNMTTTPTTGAPMHQPAGGGDRESMIRELKDEIKKLKDEVEKLKAQLAERKERAAVRRSGPKGAGPQGGMTTTPAAPTVTQ